MARSQDGPHAFVDESCRREYLLVAVRIAKRDLVPTRQLVRSISEGSRLHMSKESPRRRRKILSQLSDSGLIAADVVSASTRGQSQREARDECFKELVPELLDKSTVRLVIETCDQDQRDRAVIGQALLKADAAHGLSFTFARPTNEVLLGTADAVAWAYGAGNDWRRRTESMIASVIDCDK